MLPLKSHLWVFSRTVVFSCLLGYFAPPVLANDPSTATGTATVAAPQASTGDHKSSPEMRLPGQGGESVLRDEAVFQVQSVMPPEFRTVGGKAVARRKDGDDGQEANLKGTSSNAAKKAAIAGIPMDQLTPEARARVLEITNSVAFFRRLPTVAFDVDPQVYMYYVAHPDAAVSVWRAMKISKLKMWQTGRNEYEGDAGDGTIGTMEVLHRGVDKNLILCEGLFKSPIVSKPIKARSLVLLHTSFFREADGTIYATHRADMFVSFPSTTVEAVAKVLSPLTVNMTDRTFTEISMFLKMMSMAMARRPDWVEHIVKKMDGVPEIRRQQMLVLTAHVYAAAQKQAIANSADKKGVDLEADTPTTANGAKSIAPVAAAERPVQK